MLDNLRVCAELREIHFGSWEGRTISELTRIDPTGIEQRRRDPVHFRHPGGESFADVRARLAPLVKDLQGCRGVTLVMSHRGTLSVLERMLRGLAAGNRSVEAIEPGAFHILAGARLVPVLMEPSSS